MKTAGDFDIVESLSKETGIELPDYAKSESTKGLILILQAIDEFEMEPAMR